MPSTPSKDPGRHADGTVHNHRFPAANTALALVNKDEAQMKITKDFLKSGFISVDIFAVSPMTKRGSGRRWSPRQRRPQLMTTFAVGEEAEQQGPIVIRDVGQVAAPIDKALPSSPPAPRCALTSWSGPGRSGIFSGRHRGRVRCVARAAGARCRRTVVFWSGRVEDEGRGPVEPGAHFYRACSSTARAIAINKRNAWQARSVQYVRLIPPGAADVAHYRVRIPEDARGRSRSPPN